MNIEAEIYKSQRLLYWLISGYNIHCIPLYLWKHVTVDWIILNYNVESNYFIKQNHGKV